VTYKIRNTLVLGAIWLLITITGIVYYWVIQPKQINKIRKEIKIINKQLEDLPGLTDEVQRLTIQFQDVKRRYDSRSKEIPQLDISSQTYEYMSNGVEEAG
jgi:peptidoglycan hydrolase CwlO-like protein